MNKLRVEALVRVMGGLSNTEFADRYDLNASYLSQILNGHRPLGERAAANMEKKIGLAPGALSRPEKTASPADSNVEPGPPITSPFRAVRIVGTAQMGSEGYWYQLDEGDGVVDVPSSDPGAYALRLKGDSMAPAIRSGWIAVVEPNHRLVPGEYVMLCLADGECMLKELLYANDVEISVMSINAAYGRRTIPVEQISQVHYVGFIVPPSKVRM